MAHSSVFERVEYFDEAMEVCEDYDLWLRILKVYEIPLIEDIMTIKHAGSEDQLSTKYWALDRWHVLSLLKHADDERVRDEIVHKCEGLKRAALKYGDTILQDECEQWLESLK